MKEKPILFSTPMVQAILAGRKTMTRRVVKPQPLINSIFHGWVVSSTEPKNEGCVGWGPSDLCVTQYSKCPCEVGRILWVRETWYTPCNKNDCSEFRDCREGCNSLDDFYYKADRLFCKEPKWRPSIFMPCSAARIFLRVKSIRVERLQDITEEDARAEGVEPVPIPMHHPSCDGSCECCPVPCPSWVASFSELWDGLNSKRGYGWDLNPWVFVISFELLKGGSMENA